MVQRLTFNLDTLDATLDIREGDKEVQYTIGLEPDRSAAFVSRSVFDDMESGEPIEQKTWVTTLESLGNETALPHAVMWAARGMWGIPLELGPKVDAQEARAETQVEAAPAPAPRRKK